MTPIPNVIARIATSSSQRVPRMYFQDRTGADARAGWRLLARTAAEVLERRLAAFRLASFGLGDFERTAAQVFRLINVGLLLERLSGDDRGRRAPRGSGFSSGRFHGLGCWRS